MPYVKRAPSGRIAAVYDRPSREAKERVRANDPELLRFLGLAPTQSVVASTPEVFVAPGRSTAWQEPAPGDDPGSDDGDEVAWPADAVEPEDAFTETTDAFLTEEVDYETTEWVEPDADIEAEEPDIPAEATARYEESELEPDGDAPTIDIADDSLPAGRTASPPPPARSKPAPAATEPQPAAPSSRARSGKPSAAPERPPPPQKPSAAEPGAPGDSSALRQLDASDMEMARITEDLIDLLIGRNIINFTDFPTMAQRKLINRRALRSNMSALTNLVSDEENIF